LAKAEKYRYSFKTLEGQTCVVRFDFEGFVGSSTTLIGADQPFALGEFNTDENIFKPIRAQLATMNIIGSASGVTTNDFMMDNDDDVIVYFDFGSWTNYWMGYLTQDDFQETWIDTNHILTLRATEGLGLLKETKLGNNGAELIGTFTPFQLLEYAMQGAVQNFVDYRIFSNLFHVSMNDGNTYTGFDQCKIEAKTFQIDVLEYDDSYTTIEKINIAWNQTIYMYRGKWVIFRIEELYCPTTDNFRGFRSNSSTRTLINTRYDVNIGVDESVKPITPEMLRFLKRRTKQDIIEHSFEPINEIVQNGSFARGSFIIEIGNVKSFNIDSWTWQEGGTSAAPTFTSPITPSTGSLSRLEVYDGSFGILEDNYVRFDSAIASTNAVYRWIKSTNVELLQGEKIKFSVDTRYKNVFTDDGIKRQAYILLYGTTNNYYLKDDGTWVLTNSTFSTNENYLGTSYLLSGDPLFSDWITLSVDSQPAPQSGNINIILLNDHRTWESGGQESYYKSLQVQILSGFNGQFDIDITGIQSIFTKSDTLKMVDQNSIYFDDSFSNNYKGALLETDGVTLTDRQWHRKRYPAEIIGFRKENTVAHWQFNRFDRNKIDANFYGLTWSGGTEPIGLINTLKFVDDDPDKIYAILNLKDIDFASSTWSATLIEIWDNNRDGGEPLVKNFDADPTNGNYVVSGEFVIPFTIISAADFTYSTVTKKFTYNGSITLTDLFICNINGDINTINPLFTTATFKLYINEIEVDSATHDASTTPSIFSISLNGTYTINPSDTLYVTISSNVGDFDVNGGELSVSYDYPGTLNYDPYQDKYIYK
jgi:hypothetical protein